MAGDFIKDGKNIGNDGISDGKVYAVKTTETSFDSDVPSAGITKEQSKATTSFIESNSGNTEAFKNNSIAYDNSVEIEGNPTTRQGMVNEVSKDNGRGGTSDANNREYGGTVDNNGVVSTESPGAVANPLTDSHAQLDFTINSDTRAQFHSHPSGQIIEGGSDNANTIQMGGTKTTSSFTQTPSGIDINNIGRRTGYVFGRGNGQVYIYGKNGVMATIPMNRFVTPKK